MFLLPSPVGKLETSRDKTVIIVYDDFREAISQGSVTVNIELNGKCMYPGENQ